MIVYKQGSITKSNAVAWCCPSSTAGSMASGVASRVRELYPEFFESYAAACEQGIRPGSVGGWQNPATDGPRFIFGVMVKEALRDKVDPNAWRAGLLTVKSRLLKAGLTSLAIPAPGTALSKASWKPLRRVIEEVFADAPELRVEVYQPIVGAR